MILALLVVVASADPPAATPGAEIVKVDADAGVVVYRRIREVGGEPGLPAELWRESVVARTRGDAAVVVLCKASQENGAADCKPAKDAVAKETATVAAFATSQMAASLLVADDADAKT